jgi:hypothetical protein
VKDMLVERKVNQDDLRRDRAEWRGRAERLLAELQLGSWWRWRGRAAAAVSTVRARKTAQPAYPHNSIYVACLQLDEPQDDFAVALARPAHGPHAVDHRRLDLNEALTPIALHGPPCRALGERRGNGVIGCISKGDANHLEVLDPSQAVISWRNAGVLRAKPVALVSATPSRIVIGANIRVS